jgi:glycosyltransferase involved in cell wall biosynthesis
MSPGGGTEAVTAWILEALKDDYRIHLVTYSEMDADTLNRFYSTQLRDDHFTIIRPPLPFFMGPSGRLSGLKDRLMTRYCRSLQDDMDLFVAVGGVMDFGRPCVQFIALSPGSAQLKLLSGSSSTSNPSLRSLAKKALHNIYGIVSPESPERIRANITVATSEWAGQVIREVYGIESSHVIYPPVLENDNGKDWDSRENCFLCVARIVPAKMIELAIEILGRVRDKGFDITLRIIGRPDDPAYLRKIQRLCEENNSWASLEGFLDRKGLARYMGDNRYGINTAEDEPFGIGIAEMVKSGCITFVANSGGQTEIVGSDDLVFDNVDDAVKKISKVLKDRSQADDLLSHLRERSKLFSTETFSTRFKQVVGEAIDAKISTLDPAIHR